MSEIPWTLLIEKLGIPLGLMVVILVLGSRGLWVFGRELSKAEQRETKCQADYEKQLAAAHSREDEWKEAALNGGYLARQAVDLARRQSPGRS